MRSGAGGDRRRFAEDATREDARRVRESRGSCRARLEDLAWFTQATGSIEMPQEEHAVDLTERPGRVADAQAVEIGHEVGGFGRREALPDESAMRLADPGGSR
jgi:hypothetical protein